MSDDQGQRQVRQKITLKAAILLVLLALGFSLTACGKKAGHVDPPPEVTIDQFPRVYPDPATDPKQ
jgi:predicted small lipoprotein YifL